MANTRLLVNKTVAKYKHSLPATKKLQGGDVVLKQFIDVYAGVEEAINNGTINITNIAGAGYTNYNPATWATIRAENGASVTASKTTGQVTITCDKNMMWVELRLSSADCLADSIIVTFSGAGVTANTSLASLNIPKVQKTDTSNQETGVPSTINPYRIDLDSSPAVDVVGVGTIGNPSVSLRFNLIGQSFNNFNLGFTKL